MSSSSSAGLITQVSPRITGWGARADTHVVVCMGGPSEEREVSLSSAKGIVEALSVHLGYSVTPVDIGRDIGEVLPKLSPDIVFNAMHGPYGEDGCLPGLLEMMAVPYTHSGVLASAIAMDKLASRAFFTAHGIRMPEMRIIHRSDALQEDPMPRPYVLKPPHLGSSVGVLVIFEEDDFSFAEYDWPYGDVLLAERYIPGREIEVGILNDRALGAIELRPKRRFYDYIAKYTDGVTQHVMPAEISETATQAVLKTALKIHKLLGCRTVSRVDFRYDDTAEGDQQFYFLEINTHPGMTPLSLVPEIAAYAGISYAELVEEMVKGATCDSLKGDFKPHKTTLSRPLHAPQSNAESYVVSSKGAVSS